jgi:DNA-binding transcriptional ArsR family regulator
LTDQRSSGRVQRDAIMAAVEQFRIDHARWPSRRELADVLGMSLDNLRYHIDRLVEAGLLERLPGGTIRLIRHGGEPLLPFTVAELDTEIMAAIVANQGATDAVTTRQIVDFLARMHRPTVSRRCRYLVSAGKLIRIGNGYRVPGSPETEQK